MCRYTKARYSCGHFYERTSLGEGALVVDKCTPLKVALEYWHRQLQYLPIEKATGNTITCPRPCPRVLPFSRGVVGNRAAWEADNQTLRNNMRDLGVDDAECTRILQLESTEGLDSMRGLPKDAYPTDDYPRDWYNFIRDFQVYQSLPVKEPNVRINNLAKGCGCPRPGIMFEHSPCLVGWSGLDILALRVREWSSPPFTSWMGINYASVHSGPGRAPAGITIPISESLRQVLSFLDATQAAPLAQPQIGAMPERSVSRGRRRASSLPQRLPEAVSRAASDEAGRAGPSATQPQSEEQAQHSSTGEAVEDVAAQLEQFQMSEAALFGGPSSQ